MLQCYTRPSFLLFRMPNMSTLETYSSGLPYHHIPIRPFHCTFCNIKFKNKHDWARHEKSQHLRLHEWLCVLCYGTASSCSTTDASSNNINSRSQTDCHTDKFRVFARKDHLIQHIRRIHGLDCVPDVGDWKAEWPAIRSRCGFCGSILPTWSDRTHHLADHFKAGKRMCDWDGDHGFDIHIAAEVIQQRDQATSGGDMWYH